MEKRDLVIKFLSNECTAGEAEEAMQFIAENPGILDELAPKSEWDTGQPPPIPQHIEKVIRRHVMAAGRRGNVVAMLKPLAVAASVAVIIISAFLLMRPNRQGKPAVAVAVNEPAIAPAFDTVVNESNEVRRITLADGSRISLQSGSSVIYSTAFTGKREIFLTGKAVFRVTKNPHAPFIVYTGAITTTALGTTFLVDACDTGTAINVQLYEGKVVVRSVNERLPVSDTYLTPGEQCRIDLALALVKVSRIPEAPAGNNNRNMPAPVVKDQETEQLALDFKKVPLAATFERLQKIFGKKIVFDGNENALKLFTGRFEKNDSLQQILQIIAAMNDLQVKRQNEIFRLSQKPDTIQVKLNREAGEAAAPGLIPAPAAIAPAVTDSGTAVSPADRNGMEIVEMPMGKDYHKVPLSVVFDHIAGTNGITIRYQQDQLQQLYFTGTIPNDQSSLGMLSVICRMNGLKLQKKKGGYTVRPAKQ